MPEGLLYDKLLCFPLFQGMGHDDLTEMFSHAKLEFCKLAEGKTVVREGENCSLLHLLIDGALRVETKSEDGEYAVIEEVTAPYVIQPECLFGLRLLSRSSFVTATNANLITINKTEVALLCEEFLAFRLNLLNIIATKAQLQFHMVWCRKPACLRERIIRFLVSHSLHPKGRKDVLIYMERLAVEVNDSRLNVSRELRAMQDDGLIKLSRGRIVIPLMEQLLTVTER